MGGRPKRPRSSLMSGSAVEDMLRELQAQQGVPTAVPALPPRIPAVRYDAAVRAVREAGARADAELQGVVDVLAALRITFALSIEQDGWIAYLKPFFEHAVHKLCAEDADFASASAKWSAVLHLYLYVSYT